MVYVPTRLPEGPVIEPEADSNEDERPSKSQLKREAQQVLELAAELGEIAQQQLNALPMPEDTRKAVISLRKITSHGARKRQLHYLAKLLRRDPEDIEAIRESLALHKASAAGEKRRHAMLETWRERLLDPDEGKAALTEFASAYPGADIQMLRQMIRNYHKAQIKSTTTPGQLPKTNSRELFKWLRSAMGA